MATIVLANKGVSGGANNLATFIVDVVAFDDAGTPWNLSNQAIGIIPGETPSQTSQRIRSEASDLIFRAYGFVVPPANVTGPKPEAPATGNGEGGSSPILSWVI